MQSRKQLVAAVALACLGVACVSMAALSYTGRISLLQSPIMVIDIPMSQNLLMGEECEKACDDNFLKCTHGAGKKDYPGGYVYYPFEPTKSDPESVWKRDIKHCWYTYENQCMNRCGFPY